MARRNRKGQSLVEFALILPVLMFILVIVADMARVVAARVALSNAAREGARYGASYPTDYSGIKNRVLLEYNNTGVRVTGVELTEGNITITFPEGSWEPGYLVRVTVRCRFPLFFASWYPESMVDENGTIPIESSAEMVIL